LDNSNGSKNGIRECVKLYFGYSSLKLLSWTDMVWMYGINYRSVLWHAVKRCRIKAHKAHNSDTHIIFCDIPAASSSCSSCNRWNSLKQANNRLTDINADFLDLINIPMYYMQQNLLNKLLINTTDNASISISFSMSSSL